MLVKTHKKSLLFIFITVLIDCIGLRIIYPVAATIITELSGESVNEAVVYSGWLMTSYAIMQFICSPILGKLSDRFGRRPILLLALFGLGINYLILAYSTSLYWLFIGRIIAGVCGASITTAFAYIADISSAEHRAKNFGIISSAIGIGFIVGPVLGGMLSEFGTRVPFFVSAALAFINCVYGFLYLPESLKNIGKTKFSLKDISPIQFITYTKGDARLKALFVVMLLFYLSAQVIPSIWPFYTKYRFNWNDLQIGYSIAFVGFLVALVKLLLVDFSQKQLGIKQAIYIGFVLNVLGLTLMAFASNTESIALSIIIYSLGGITPTLLQGSISNITSEHKQGEIQGVLTSLLSLSTIVTPFISTHLFYHFTREASTVAFSGAPFILAALLVFLSLIVYLLVPVKD